MSVLSSPAYQYLLHTFEAKYFSDYKILHQLNKCTLLLLTQDGKECKINIGDVKPCTMTNLIELAWDSFILSACNKPTEMPYNQRPRMLPFKIK